MINMLNVEHLPCLMSVGSFYASSIFFCQWSVLIIIIILFKIITCFLYQLFEVQNKNSPKEIWTLLSPPPCSLLLKAATVSTTSKCHRIIEYFVL